MRFITCLDYNKVCELLEISNLVDNHLFRFDLSSLDSMKSLLEELNGEFNNLNVGLFIPQEYSNLSDIWSNISRLIPVKSGDAIFQFNVNEDECLFFEFNDFMDCVYSKSNNLDSIILDKPSPMCIALSDKISSMSFDCAYIVDTQWGKNSFDNDVNGSLINSLIDLNPSAVWRS